MKKSYSILFLLLFCIQYLLYGQGELDDQEKIFYRNEKTIGLLLNSNGFGINGRYAKQINYRNKMIYNVDIAGIKHPKEYKIPSADYYARSFVLGKLNSFFTVRAGIGRQHEMYRKIDKGGISVKHFYNFGPSFGFYKPIYYKIQELSLQPGVYMYYMDKFDPKVEQNIIGKYSFFKGFNETRFTPGIYGKFGFSFEYSSVHDILHALEAGITIDAYAIRVPIMANNKEKYLYPSLFVSYRFGKIVDAKFSPKKRREMRKQAKEEE